MVRDYLQCRTVSGKDGKTLIVIKIETSYILHYSFAAIKGSDIVEIIIAKTFAKWFTNASDLQGSASRTPESRLRPSYEQNPQSFQTTYFVYPLQR